MAEDGVGEPCVGSPVCGGDVRGGDGSGGRPALAATATPDRLAPPRVHAILVLDLLAALSGGGRGRATLRGAPAPQAGGRSRGGGGILDHLLQGGALPQRVQAGAAAAWRKTRGQC